MVHTIVLEYVQALTDSRVWGALVRAISKPRRVAVRHDGDDTGRSFRCRTVDGCNAAIGDRTPHDGAVRQTWYVELGSVRGAARDLLAAVDAADWLSDNCGGHARAPAVSTARTRTRCMSSILKLLCPRPCAPSAASPAAGRSTAGSRLAPASAASTRGTRHGLVPTPPRATRACRMRPPSISSATAADTTANSNEARSRTLRQWVRRATGLARSVMAVMTLSRSSLPRTLVEAPRRPRTYLTGTSAHTRD